MATPRAPRAAGSSPEHSIETLRPPSSGQNDSLASVFESGIAPARTSSASTPALMPSFAAQGESHAQSALAACTRAEANLGAVLRTIQHLAAAVGSAQEAKVEIVDELESLRALMASADEQELTFKHRIALLEQGLERSERESARERAFLFEQQDAFIAGLWDEHEQELTELRRRYASVEQMLRESREENRALSSIATSAASRAEELTRKLSRAETDIGRLDADLSTALDALSRCQNERDQSLTLVTHVTRERDQLRQDLARALGTLAGRASESGAAASTTNPTGTPIPLLTRTESGRMTAAQSERELQIPRSPSQITGSTPIARVAVSSVRSVPAAPEGPSSSRPPSSAYPTPISSASQPPVLGLPATESEPAPSVSSRSGIKHKPDASTRPLIGYSLSSDELHESGRESSRPGGRGPNR